MTAQRNHYEVLGVSATATTDQIKTKYREMARMFHPDVAKDKALGQKMFTQINQAYRVLGDPERRAQYDSYLRVGGISDAGPIASNGATANGAKPTNGAKPADGTAPTNGSTSANGARAAADPMAVTRLVGDADFALMNSDAVAAQAHCEAALRLDPQNAKALGLLGDALAAQGRREEAAAAYRRSLAVAPSPMVQAKLSRLDSGGSPTLPPGGAPPRSASPNGNGASRSAPAAKPSGGLFGLFPGKKK